MIKWLLECFTPCGRWNAVYLINFLKEISMNEKLQWNGRRLIERTPAPPSVECGTHEYRDEKSEKIVLSASVGRRHEAPHPETSRPATTAATTVGRTDHAWHLVRRSASRHAIDSSTKYFSARKIKKKTREIHLNINILHQMGNNCFSEDSSCWFFKKLFPRMLISSEITQMKIVILFVRSRFRVA